MVNAEMERSWGGKPARTPPAEARRQ